MRVYREHLAIFVVVVCVFALLFTMISYFDIQLDWVVRNAETETLDSNEAQWTSLTYDGRAETVEFRVEYFSDQEFDLWLMDSEEWNVTDRSTGPEQWFGHGIAGTGVHEWTVSIDDLEGNLILVEESRPYGDRGPFGDDIQEANFDWEITVNNIINPMETTFTWIALSLLGLALVLLAVANYLPREKIADFTDLYPEFPGSMRTGDGGPN